MTWESDVVEHSMAEFRRGLNSVVVCQCGWNLITCLGNSPVSGQEDSGEQMEWLFKEWMRHVESSMT